MGREVSHLPSAKGSRRAALRSADEALAETEGIAAKVSEMVRRIEVELRMKVTEMQSFSPEEMGNIPRKCESNIIHHHSPQNIPWNECCRCAHAIN